jgi:hypothetical protein
MVLGRYAGSVGSTEVGVAPTDLGSSTAGIGPNACENRGLNPSALRWALSEVRCGVGYDASLGGDSVTLQLMLGTVVDVQQVLSGQPARPHPGRRWRGEAGHPQSHMRALGGLRNPWPRSGPLCLLASGGESERL